jgi:hypothetical protein
MALCEHVYSIFLFVVLNCEFWLFDLVDVSDDANCKRACALKLNLCFIFVLILD